jgi:hypothetical protein
VRAIYFCNDELGQIVLLAREQVAQEALRVNWVRTVRLYESYLWASGRFLAESVREPVTVSEARERKPPKRGFDILPDSEQTGVERVRRDRRFIEAFPQLGDRSSATPTLTATAQLARDKLASSWTQLQAVEAVLAEYAAELDEDPLRPDLRACLDATLLEITAIRDDLSPFVDLWELPDDHAEAVALLRDLGRRVLR